MVICKHYINPHEENRPIMFYYKFNIKRFFLFLWIDLNINKYIKYMKNIRYGFYYFFGEKYIFGFTYLALSANCRSFGHTNLLDPPPLELAPKSTILRYLKKIMCNY